MRLVLLFALLAVSSIAWAQSNGYFGSSDSAVQTFALGSLEQKSAITFPGPVNYMAIAPDGKNLFLEDGCCSDPDATASGVMDVPLGQVQGTFLNLPIGGGGGPLAISPNGRTLYISDDFNANITVFDLESGQVTSTIVTPGGSLYQTVDLKLSADGSTLFQAAQYIQTCPECSDSAQSYLTVIDAKSGTILRNIPVAVSVLAIAPNGKTAYAGTSSIDVIDLISGDVRATIPVAASALVLSPDGLQLYAGSDKVYVISTTTNSVTATVTITEAAQIVSLSPVSDSQTIYAAYSRVGFGASGGVAEIQLPSATVVRTAELAGTPGPLVISLLDETLLAALTSPSITGVIDTATNVLTRVIPFPGGPSPVVSHDGLHLYMENLQNLQGQVTVLDAISLSQIIRIEAPAPLENDVTLLAITPDDRNLIYLGAQASGAQALVEVNLATLVSEVLINSRIEAVVISRDSHYLYPACAGCTPGNANLFGIIKYDFVSHKVTGFNPTAALSGLFLSPDGSMLYFGANAVPYTGALNIEVLNTATMKPTGLISQYQVSSAIALSADGKTFWALSFAPLGSDPETLYQFDAATFQLLNQVSLPPGSGGGLSVTPDGNKVYFSVFPETGIYDVATQALTYTTSYVLFSDLQFRTL